MARATKAKTNEEEEKEEEERKEKKKEHGSLWQISERAIRHEC